MSLTPQTSRFLDVLGRVFVAALFVRALPGKFADFAGNAGSIVARGIPEPLASILLVAAILVLIAGVILLVFDSSTIVGASLLLVFLVPTTLIFHTVPVDGSFFINLALIGALILAITRSTANAAPNFRGLRNKHRD